MDETFDSSIYEGELLKSDSFRQSVAALSDLPAAHVIAFSLWCIERLLPAFANVCRTTGNEASLSAVSRIVERLNAFSDGASFEPSEINKLRVQLEAVDEGEEDCCEDWNDGVDALSALSLALDYCLSRSPMKVALVGQVLVDNLDRKLLNLNLGVASGPHSPAEIREINERLSIDPAMLRELAIQKHAIEILAASKTVTHHVRATLSALST